MSFHLSGHHGHTAVTPLWREKHRPRACFNGNALNWILAIWGVMLIAFLASSCGPKPAPETPPEISKEKPKDYPAPTELRARAFHRRANLSWKTNRSEDAPIMGYNVYLWNEKDSSSSSLENFRRITEEPYPGDTDPTTEYESFPLEDVENGMLYRVYVTTVFPGDIESKPSNIAEVIPRPAGGFTLRESFKGSESGFSFRKLKSLPTDDLDNDIYLATIDGRLFVASPKRLDIVLRETKFFRLGAYPDLDAVRLVELKARPDNALQIRKGEVCVFQDQDNCFGLLRFDAVDLRNKTVTLSFIYQPRPMTFAFH